MIVQRYGDLYLIRSEVVQMQDSLLTDLILKRLDEIILNFQKTRDYELTFVKLDMCYCRVREALQEHDFSVVADLDNCIIEILTVFQEYFYTKGYRDGRRSKGIFKRLLAWVKRKTVKAIAYTSVYRT